SVIPKNAASCATSSGSSGAASRSSATVDRAPDGARPAKHPNRRRRSATLRPRARPAQAPSATVDRAPPGRARRSGASAAHAACDAARDEMGEPQGLRDVAVQGRRTNQRASLARRQPDALNPDALSGATEPARTRTGMLVVRELEQLHRTRRLDQAPLALGAADPRARWIFGGEQRPANRGEI